MLHRVYLINGVTVPLYSGHMALHVLKERAAHTYFDDLESFYYVSAGLSPPLNTAGMLKADSPRN